MSRNTARQSARSAWSDFWSEGVHHADHRFRDTATARLLDDHWQRVLADRFSAGGRVTVLDAACGEGALLRAAQANAARMADVSLDLYCTDIAAAAVEAAAEAVPAPVRPVVADGAAMPFADGSFDCVISQFGLEYAGEDAFADAARVTAPDGALDALVHREGGAIETECQANLGLLEAVREAGLLKALERLNRLAGRQATGKAAPAALDRAVQKFRAASDAVAEALRGAAPGAARSLIERLWQDCARAAARAGRYGDGELEAWLAAHATELEAYAHRMRSMIAAACSSEEMATLAARVAAEGLSDVRIDELRVPASGASLAWTLRASGGGD